MGLLLQQTGNEAMEGNVNAQQAMKKSRNCLFTPRRNQCTRAVYRVTGLRLKECSGKVEFVPVGETLV